MLRKPRGGNELNKPHGITIFDQRTKSKNVHKKSIRFDECNIRETHDALIKENTFIKVPETNTPYIKKVKPLAAEDLRERLQEAIDRSNKLHNDDDGDYLTLRSFNMDDLVSPADSIEDINEEERREEFQRKRRQYNLAEFTIVKQQIMSREIADPGPSIGNWKLDDRKVDNGPELSLFIGKDQMSAKSSTINFVTLRRITKQARNDSEFLYYSSTTDSKVY